MVGVKSWYIGESGRTAHERGAEHLAAGDKAVEKFALTKHGQAEHGLGPGEVPTYTMATLRSFRTALERLVAQAIAIESYQVDFLLNSKVEWGVQFVFVTHVA